jgi:DNA-directed RNA polymerase subunit M/transcription elongation factor TFIIS
VKLLKKKKPRTNIKQNKQEEGNSKDKAQIDKKENIIKQRAVLSRCPECDNYPARLRIRKTRKGLVSRWCYHIFYSY